MSEDDGFLSRWSRRKVQVQTGVAPVEPAVLLVEPLPAQNPVAAEAVVDAPVDEPTQPTQPPLTLDDVAQLTPQSDYSRFVAPNVDEGVKRAAMKKLFTDPHYNIMDGLDTYIDDYGKPDPIPESMLRQMTQSKFLGLFDHEEEPPPPVASTAASTDGETAPPVPQSLPEPELSHDENADLRLQQDDAAGRPGAEPGAEPVRRG